MKIKLIPDVRDEEKIAEIKEARQVLTGEAWEEFCYDRASEDEEWLDAMYYASEYGDETLEKWGRYFLDLLTDEKKYYFAADMGGLEY